MTCPAADRISPSCEHAQHPWYIEELKMRRKSIVCTLARLLGQMLPVTHGTHILLCYRCDSKGKPTDEFPSEVIYPCVLPQGIRVMCPRDTWPITSWHVVAVTARDAFSTTGNKRMLSPPLGLTGAFGRIVHTKIRYTGKYTTSSFTLFICLYFCDRITKLLSHSPGQLPWCFLYSGNVHPR